MHIVSSPASLALLPVCMFLFRPPVVILQKYTETEMDSIPSMYGYDSFSITCVTNGLLHWNARDTQGDFEDEQYKFNELDPHEWSENIQIFPKI